MRRVRPRSQREIDSLSVRSTTFGGGVMNSADDRQDPLRNPEDGSESTGRDPWSAPPDPTTGFGQGGYDQTAPAGLPQPPGYGPPAPYGSSPHDQGTPAAFGYGPGAYGPGAYDGPLGSGQGHPPLRPTNGMAIASLVLGIVFLLVGAISGAAGSVS